MCQRPAKLIRIELRIVPRARHSADIRQTFNTVGLEQRDEAFNGESRVTDGEYRAVGPTVVAAAADVSWRTGFYEHRAVDQLEHGRPPADDPETHGSDESCVLQTLLRRQLEHLRLMETAEREQLTMFAKGLKE